MNYTIRNEFVLRKLLWLDTILGGVTALVGLLFPTTMNQVLRLPRPFIITVSAITLCYAIVACTLAIRRPTSVRLFRLLVKANWVWSVISVILLVIYIKQAEPFGYVFLIGQPLVVGGLAYAEGKQLVK